MYLKIRNFDLLNLMFIVYSIKKGSFNRSLFYKRYVLAYKSNLNILTHIS